MSEIKPDNWNPRYVDDVTGATYSIDELRWRSDDHNPLNLDPGPGIDRSGIDTSTRSLWRYRQSLPGNISEPVSLGEGCTPLIPSPVHGDDCHLKLEWFAPSGSFKDRGASVMVSFLKSRGVTSILEDSSGNGGAAIAAFGAAAGMDVKILAPDSTQPAKVAQSRAYGATVQLVPGPRENCETEAIRQSTDIFYASHNWHPFFIQGTKSLGYELWEDFGFNAPDNIIIPTGADSNVLGCDLAFRELMNAGAIDRLPRLFCAQPENCSPIHHCLSHNIDAPDGLEFAPTIAEGTAIKQPVRLARLLDAVRRSNGGSASVSEADILKTVRALAARGIYVEPTCASAAAAWEQLVAAGTISRNDRTAVVLTGTGLKATAFMTEQFS